MLAHAPAVQQDNTRTQLIQIAYLVQVATPVVQAPVHELQFEETD